MSPTILLLFLGAAAVSLACLRGFSRHELFFLQPPSHTAARSTWDRLGTSNKVGGLKRPRLVALGLAVRWVVPRRTELKPLFVGNVCVCVYCVRCEACATPRMKGNGEGTSTRRRRRRCEMVHLTVKFVAGRQ